MVLRSRRAPRPTARMRRGRPPRRFAPTDNHHDRAVTTTTTTLPPGSACASSSSRRGSPSASRSTSRCTTRRRGSSASASTSRTTRARAIEPLDTGIPATTMETRDRLSDLRSSADVVVDPESEIRAPVSGTVVSSGSYVLYCGLRDYFINIEPDDHPGWRVKVLHITDLNVGNGDRVVQGETVIAPTARQLPFAIPGRRVAHRGPGVAARAHRGRRSLDPERPQPRQRLRELLVALPTRLVGVDGFDELAGE